jgi:hypothetical protein
LSKTQWIAVILAILFFSALGVFGVWHINQTSEYLLALRERAAYLERNRPPEPDPEPCPPELPTRRPPRTSDFAPADPEAYLTRAMFTALIASLEDADTELPEDTEPHFIDVPAYEWYAGAVEWAFQMGLVNGVGGGKFAPEDPISREQMAVMINRYMAFKEMTVIIDETPDAADYEDISSWAFDAVTAMRALGIIPDSEDGLFDPRGKVTNFDADAVFERLYVTLR